MLLACYRSAITIFPQRRNGPCHDFRVWNQQLISYAGYIDHEDPSKIIGDPINVEMTQVCVLLAILFASCCYPSGNEIPFPSLTHCLMNLVTCLCVKMCEKLGWQGQRTRWDILPLVLSADGQDPLVFQIPDELVLRVKLNHSK